MVGGGSGSDAQRWVEHDLGAVGAPGAPSAVGLSLDAEAVVDLGVVALAEQRGVLQAGLAAVDPLEQMVDVAPVGRGVAAGEHALPIAQLVGQMALNSGRHSSPSPRRR